MLVNGNIEVSLQGSYFIQTHRTHNNILQTTSELILTKYVLVKTSELS